MKQQTATPIGSARQMTRLEETAVVHATVGGYHGANGNGHAVVQDCADDKFDRLLTAVSRDAVHRLDKELNQCNG